jgi:rod shape-determining protein MreB and related proteins
MFTPEIGIDLGTTSILVFLKGKGIVLREPSILAVSKHSKEIYALGDEARLMLGRTPGDIVAIRPLIDGVIADYTHTQRLLEELIKRACGRRFNAIFKPRVLLSVPSDTTSVERRAVLQAAREAGAGYATYIEEPLAAAMGAGLPIQDPAGNMVVDIGGGTTDVAVISLGGIVTCKSIRVGGNKMDEMVARYIKNEYNLQIGDRTAEEIKIRVGSAFPLDEELTIEVRGRDLLAGLPKTVTVSSVEVREAIGEAITGIVEKVKAVLLETPPELAADIIESGTYLTGGGALLRGLDRLLELETGLKIHIADDPLSCVALGTGRALEHLKVIERTHRDLPY